VLNSSGIIFSPPKITTKNKLLSVVDNSNVDIALAHRAVPAFPPRRLSQILTLIKNGHAEAITIMEWLCVFQDNFDWHEEQEEDTDAICLLLWQAIIENSSVSQIALFKAALYLDGQQDKFPIILINSLELAVQFVSKTDRLRINWLLAIKSKKFNQCAEQALARLHTPLQYLKAIGLPKAARYRTKILSHLVSNFPKDIEGKHATWLLACFEEMTQQELLSNCDELFVKAKKYNQYIELWVKKHCLPDVDNSLWFELSEQSRQQLRTQYKLSNYYTFKQVVTALCMPEVARYLNLSEQEVKQLQSRAAFWANYSEQFNQIRILLPKNTTPILKDIINVNANHIITLPNDVSENSEACVFELADKIVVEIFRGEASEIRIFEKSARNENRLLRDNNLTLKIIRNMSHDYVHDHVILWQYHCEKLLRTRLNITPNENTSYFKGIPKRFARYCYDNGLFLANKELLHERSQQLEQWNQLFWQRELQSEKYQGMSSFKRTIEKDYQIAIQAKLHGDDEKYAHYIQHAANKGHLAAMYILGLSIISDPKSNENLKVAGEQWICKSAEQGYQLAIDMVKKFNLVLKDGAEKNVNHERKHLSLAVSKLDSLVTKHIYDKVELLEIKDELLRRKTKVSKALLVKVNNYLRLIEEKKKSKESNGDEGTNNRTDRPYLTLNILELAKIVETIKEDKNALVSMKEELWHRNVTRDEKHRTKQAKDLLNTVRHYLADIEEAEMKKNHRVSNISLRNIKQRKGSRRY
jgi:hypothetical protein